MPWKLIGFLIVLTIVVLFTGFNLNNDSNISFGFHTIPHVPVFLSLFIAFLVGAFVMLPFAVKGRKPKGSLQNSRDSRKDEQLPPVPEMVAEPEQPVEAEAPPKKKRARK